MRTGWRGANPEEALGGQGESGSETASPRVSNLSTPPSTAEASVVASLRTERLDARRSKDDRHVLPLYQTLLKNEKAVRATDRVEDINSSPVGSQPRHGMLLKVFPGGRVHVVAEVAVERGGRRG